MNAVAPATFPLDHVQSHDRIVVVGKSGSGKSHFGKQLIARELINWRVLVVDPEDEWSQKGRVTEHVTLGPLRDRCTYDELIQDPRAYLDDENLSLAVVISEREAVAADEVAGLVHLVQHTGDVFVVFGEVRYYVKQHVAAEALVKIARRGRHWGCPVLFESQRMMDVPPDARSQATQLVSFIQTHPADLAALEDLVGHSEPDFSERCQKLGVGDYVFWRDSLSQPRKKK